MSRYSIDITLRWGDFHTLGKKLVELASSSASTVLAIKGAHITKFNGKTVGTISATNFVLDPAIPEIEQLQSWFHQRYCLASSPSLIRKFLGTSKQGYPQRTIVDLIESHLDGKQHGSLFMELSPLLTCNISTSLHALFHLMACNA